MINIFAKKLSEITPTSISKSLAKIPFKFRYGREYSNFEKIIKESRNWSEDELESYVVKHFNKIFQHAKENSFYKEKYKDYGVLDLKVNYLDDIKKIPILTKKEVRDNISKFNGHHNAQTGGTTGVPTPIYLDEHIWAREWAHFHDLWGKEGYMHHNIKFIFREADKNAKFLEYEFDYNHYAVNIYRVKKISKDEIDYFFKTLIDNRIKYLHGYPSAIYEFLKKLETSISKAKFDVLKNQIECCFLSSEAPQKHIINYVKNKCEFNFISWYGHTEACVLAGSKKNELVYFPYHTYGYVEVQDKKLLGTSYHNFDMPLIRYDSGDIVDEKRYENGIIKSFKIKDGRTFNYIVDKNDLRISISGIIEEIPNQIYDYIDFVQIFQNEKGKATAFISGITKSEIEIIDLMNLVVYDIDFEYKFIKEPVKTRSGKVNLRITNLPN